MAEITDRMHQRLRAFAHRRGALAGRVGLAGDLGNAQRHRVHRVGGMADIAGDFGGRRALLLHRRGDRTGDAVQCGDRLVDPAHGGDRSGGRRANLTDAVSDFLG